MFACIQVINGETWMSATIAGESHTYCDSMSTWLAPEAYGRRLVLYMAVSAEQCIADCRACTPMCYLNAFNERGVAASCVTSAAADIGQNTWELWRFSTGGGWFHPIHMHMVRATT